MGNDGLMQVRVAVPEDVLFRELEGEAVLLNLSSEQYFGLDAVGTTMWHALTAGGTVDDACRSLLEIYDVSDDELRTDVQAFVGELAEAGLVALQESGDAG